MRTILKRVYRKIFPLPDRPERLMSRVHLYEELLAIAGKESVYGKRVLEIGPKDGLDSKRLAVLCPKELVLMDLPEKRVENEKWINEIEFPNQYIEQNFLYLLQDEYQSLGKFSLIWCTGALYHNAEQMRFLRKLYKLLEIEGYLVIESATLRLTKSLRNGCFVQIHYPETYRNTGTITHLPTANAVKAWLAMVGFQEIYDSSCYNKHDRQLIGQRYACICRKNGEDESDAYYQKSGLNPKYRFGDST